MNAFLVGAAGFWTACGTYYAWQAIRCRLHAAAARIQAAQIAAAQQAAETDPLEALYHAPSYGD